MRKTIKRIILFFIFIFILDLVISVWMLAHRLKTRYPHLDFKKAQFGWASWYSEKDKNINKKTANGEVFDDAKLTCASWDYPFNTKLIVINTLTGKWVVCRVNDRGPNRRLDRKLDLTLTAFRRIFNPKRGLVYVAFLPTES